MSMYWTDDLVHEDLCDVQFGKPCDCHYGRLRTQLDAARDYIALLEQCQDGYYRVQESEEAKRWEALSA